ncbi:MAG: murein biosynthesis integral membrane protein MurJ [Candidatus Omnitrophota bacterium]
MDTNKSLIASVRLVSLGTLSSRVLGFVRDVLIARFFGTGMRAQAFIVAFRLPNLLREVVGETSASATVVPVFSHLAEEEKPEEFWRAANCLLNVLIVILCAFTLLGELFAPLVVRIIAPGFTKDPATLLLTIKMTRLLFPYILLIGLSIYAMAMLNSLKTFALPAFAPCMLNVSLIVSMLLFCQRFREPAHALAVGVLIGGLLQLLMQIPLLLNKGFRLKGGFCLVHPKIQEIGRLFLARTLGIAIYHINVFVDTILGSLSWIVGEGAVAALYYSNRIIQFPIALFGLALAQVATPTLSAQAARKDFAELKQTVSFSLRSIFVTMLPASAGIMVLARPLTSLLFERGNFTSYSTQITASVLFFYCLGLVSFAAAKVLASCFYALKDTATPARVAAGALLVNVVLSVALMRPFKVVGLALGTSCATYVNFSVLLSLLGKRVGVIPQLGKTVKGALISTLAMAVVLWLVFYHTGPLLYNGKVFLLKMLFTITLGISVYVAALALFAPEEKELFTRWISRKR